MMQLWALVVAWYFPNTNGSCGSLFLTTTSRGNGLARRAGNRGGVRQRVIPSLWWLSTRNKHGLWSSKSINRAQLRVPKWPCDCDGHKTRVWLICSKAALVNFWVFLLQGAMALKRVGKAGTKKTPWLMVLKFLFPTLFCLSLKQNNELLRYETLLIGQLGFWTKEMGDTQLRTKEERLAQDWKYV